MTARALVRLPMAGALLGGCALAVGGCAVGRGEPSLVSDDPALKVPAMHKAGRTDSERSVPKLINELESSDPAIRMFAARALEQITGQTRGYRFYDDEPVRAVAVRQWRVAYGLPTDPPRTLTTQPSTQPLSTRLARQPVTALVPAVLMGVSR